MAEMNFKRGLFGYTRSSVYAYITELNHEFKDRLENFGTSTHQDLAKKCKEYEEEVKKLTEKQTELLDEISKYIKEQDALNDEIKSLRLELQNLKSDNSRKDIELRELRDRKGEYQNVQNDLADVIIEAKKFANNLMQNAENEYKKQTAENNAKLNAERDRLADYIKSIDELSGSVRDLCLRFNSDIEVKKKQLAGIRSQTDISEAI